MSPREAEMAYTLVEAARIKKVSPDYLRRFINATEGHRCKAKKAGKGYRISASALDAWFDGLEDA